MGLPSILIEFRTKASMAIEKGDRGIVAFVTVDENCHGITRLDTITDIPNELNADNKRLLTQGFMGGDNPINYLQLVVAPTILEGLELVQTIKFDYLALSPIATANEVTTTSIIIKTMRDNDNIKVKAVLPNCYADHEGIINFTTNNITLTDGQIFTTEEFCIRIASLLAGTPLQKSATYHVFNDIESVELFKKYELDEKINRGEFIIFDDGDKIKVGRAINSLTTIGELKSEDYKQTKIVDIMDLIYQDIKRACEDNYIGKYANTYQNKQLLVIAIDAYLIELQKQVILDNGIQTEIDIESQKAFLRVTGYDVDNMSDQEIKEANTKTHVFIKSSYKILSAIEDIQVIFDI